MYQNELVKTMQIKHFVDYYYLQHADSVKETILLKVNMKDIFNIISVTSSFPILQLCFMLVQTVIDY